MHGLSCGAACECGLLQKLFVEHGLPIIPPESSLIERQCRLLSFCESLQERNRNASELEIESERPAKHQKTSTAGKEAWRCTTHPHYTCAVGELCVDAFLRGAEDIATVGYCV